MRVFNTDLLMIELRTDKFVEVYFSNQEEGVLKSQSSFILGEGLSHFNIFFGIHGHSSL